MGCGSSIATEINHDYKKECLIKGENPSLISESIIDKLCNSIARIEFKLNNQLKISTGFFIKLNIKKKQYKFIQTCEHSITQDNIDSKIIIDIYYGKVENETKFIIELDKNKRYIKAYKLLDTTLIEIIDKDNIPEDKFLLPDLNYINGFSQYKNQQVFTAGYPNVSIHKKEKHLSSGIIKRNGKKQFQHTCDTREGSSGSPLLNINNQVIGMHFGCDKKEENNFGTFIGAIIDQLNCNDEEHEDSKEEKTTNKKIEEEKHSNKKIEQKGNNKYKKDIEEYDKNFKGFMKNYKKNTPLMNQLDSKTLSLMSDPIYIDHIKSIYSNPKLLEILSKFPQNKEIFENKFSNLIQKNPEIIENNISPQVVNYLSEVLNESKDNKYIKKNKNLNEDNDSIDGNIINSSNNINDDNN